MNADALTNEYEYFAELSEAYFWRNDFFPFNRNQLYEYDPMGAEMIRTGWGITIDYKIAVTTWIGVIWLFISMFVQMGNNTQDLPVSRVFSGLTGNYFWLHLAFLMEWIALIIVAVVEFIAWLVAMFGDPMFFVIYAYISLWGSAILYILPVIMIIIHSINHGTSNTVNWTTDGGLPHLIIDIFIWLITGLFHYFFYPELVIQYSQQLGDRLQGVFAPANYISDQEKRAVTTIYDVNNYGEVPQESTNDVKTSTQKEEDEISKW
jgi:hypothetical protein